MNGALPLGEHVVLPVREKEGDQEGEALSVDEGEKDGEREKEGLGEGEQHHTPPWCACVTCQ